MKKRIDNNIIIQHIFKFRQCLKTIKTNMHFLL